MTAPGTVPAPIVVTHRSGLSFGIQIGAHEVIVDQPVRAGGDDTGPTPLDLLGGSLGSCIALYVHKFLEARSLPTADLRVEVTQHVVPNPKRVGRFDVRVVLPEGIPTVYLPMVEAVAHVCPSHGTLGEGAEVAIAVESLVGAG